MDKPKKDYTQNLRTIKSLRLDIQSAREGKTWLLLPEGYRQAPAGKDYPLPSFMSDIQTLAQIPIPKLKRDQGVVYLRRINKEFTKRLAHRQSALLGIARKETQVNRQAKKFQQKVRHFGIEMKKTLNGLKEEAEKAKVTLNEVLDLAKVTVKGQLEAHLAKQKWQGEEITAAAARDLAKIAINAVKGLGVPSEARDQATEAMFEEFAEALKDSQEVISMAPGGDEEIEN